MVPSVAGMAPGHEHHEGDGGVGWWFGRVAAIVLVLLLANALWPQPVPMAGKESDVTEPDCETAELAVSGMRCNGCVESVTRALEDVDGVESATVDLATGRATVWGSMVDRSALKRAVTALGFEVELVGAESTSAAF